jgi:outer membrane protein assembly factor BamE (lipoprotein component of BamABCDE complex)
MAAFGLILSACSPRVTANGNLPDPERLAQIAPGKQTRQQVQQLLGSPSSVTAFNGETWFYISQRTEAVAFFRPEIQDRQVVVIRFNKNGVVEDIETLGLESARNLQPVERVTPTAGNEMTVLEQMIGNFGRFAKKDEKKQSPTGTPAPN